MPALILGLFCFLEGFYWVTRISFLKRGKKGALELRVTQLFFVYYQPKFHEVLLLPQPDVAYISLNVF